MCTRKHLPSAEGQARACVQSFEESVCILQDSDHDESTTGIQMEVRTLTGEVSIIGVVLYPESCRDPMKTKIAPSIVDTE